MHWGARYSGDADCSRGAERHRDHERQAAGAGVGGGGGAHKVLPRGEDPLRGERLHAPPLQARPRRVPARCQDRESGSRGRDCGRRQRQWGRVRVQRRNWTHCRICWWEPHRCGGDRLARAHAHGGHPRRQWGWVPDCDQRYAGTAQDRRVFRYGARAGPIGALHLPGGSAREHQREVLGVERFRLYFSKDDSLHLVDHIVLFAKSLAFL
mmetsp:Transcript_33144/g.55554  ORF Transcript_33144/g.55554 Transcript_33144/m.55554 type:complete len:210 (-) Transcript_33144:163-792(-)